MSAQHIGNQQKPYESLSPTMHSSGYLDLEENAGAFSDRKTLFGPKRSILWAIFFVMFACTLACLISNTTVGNCPTLCTGNWLKTSSSSLLFLFLLFLFLHQIPDFIPKNKCRPGGVQESKQLERSNLLGPVSLLGSHPGITWVTDHLCAHEGVNLCFSLF